MARVARGSGCLLGNLELTFRERVDALDQMRFKRHWQRRVQPGAPDLVTLRDIKDVVLFQVQQELPAVFLKLFHTPAVDRFLRTLILYSYYYIQTWERMALTSKGKGCTIREPIMRPGQRRRQQNLATLRVLLARDYHALLLGEGTAQRFHHAAQGFKSRTQRDARLWELLLRLSVRVTWVALQRRYMNLVDVEVGRLFRGGAFNLAKRRVARGLQERDSRGVREVRDEVLHGPGERTHRLFTRSPATLELLGRLGGDDVDWRLLALGRLPLPSEPEFMCGGCLEAAYTLNEEDLVREHGLYIGILGMPRAHFDVMLNLRLKDKEKDELLLPPGSFGGQQSSVLFPEDGTQGHAQPEPPQIETEEIPVAPDSEASLSVSEF